MQLFRKEALMSEDPFFFEVLDDLEMSQIGQRLIVQGNELLDDADLDDQERKKVEKILSDCWTALQAIKTVRDSFSKIAADYRQGKDVNPRRGISLKDFFIVFVEQAAVVLHKLAKIIGVMTRHDIVVRNSIHQYERFPDSIRSLSGPPKKRLEELAQVLEKAQGTWLRRLSILWDEIQKDKTLEGYFRFKRGVVLNHGKISMSITLSSGIEVEPLLIQIWKGLLDFCEDVMGYSIQLRFLEFIQGLEFIPNDQRDAVFPRRFKVIIQRDVF